MEIKAKSISCVNTININLLLNKNFKAPKLKYFF